MILHCNVFCVSKLSSCLIGINHCRHFNTTCKSLNKTQLQFGVVSNCHKLQSLNLSSMPKQQKKSKCHQENILWIDLEMTGLDPITDHILEVACIVTNDELDILD